jgi:MFS family permease
MPTTQMMSMALNALTRDGWLLFVTRFARLFAYGSLSVILVFYLIGLGLTEVQSGLVLTLTLAGDVVVSLFLTTRADRIGRRRMLIIGAILMAAAGLVLASTHNLFFLIVAGTIGAISPSGNEVGPFLSIEQAALSHIVPATARTEVFAWYTMAGSLATAIGALFAGFITQALQHTSMTPVASYRAVVLVYAALGILLALLFIRLSALVEVRGVPGGAVSSPGNILGITQSRNIVLKLSIRRRRSPRRKWLPALPVPRQSAGRTNTRQSFATGAAISPLFVGFLFAKPSLISAPFFIAGTLKIVYDLLLYKAFVAIKPPEEQSRDKEV